MENNILNYNSVENIPHINAKAAFQVNSASHSHSAMAVTEWQGSHIMPLIPIYPD